MNASEANALNSLLRWVTGQGGDPDRARTDAMWLAERAAKTLRAGLMADDVATHWPAISPGDVFGVAADHAFVLNAIEAWQDGADPGDTLRAIRDQLAGKTPGEEER